MGVRINAEAEYRDAMQSMNIRTVTDAAARVIESAKAARIWGIEKSHPDMRTAQKVSNDLRGEAVVLFAEDEVRLKNSRTNLGDAEKAAERIEKAIKESIDYGAPVDRPKLEQSRKIALEFRELEGMRKRLANREKQLAAKQ